VCCPVEDSASAWSLVQRSPIECGVSKCDFEVWTLKNPGPTRGFYGHGKMWYFVRNDVSLLKNPFDHLHSSCKYLNKNKKGMIFWLYSICCRMHFDREQEEPILIDPLQEVGSVTGGQWLSLFLLNGHENSSFFFPSKLKMATDNFKNIILL